ncbi:MAG: hypothetical protein ACI9G1_002555 [Pirellulaceae bacterium]
MGSLLDPDYTPPPFPRLPDLDRATIFRCDRPVIFHFEGNEVTTSHGINSNWRLLLALMAVICLSGCVRRRLTVRSNPAGARVYIDDQEIGDTPTSVDYTYYGTRKIQLVKDGFRTETVKQEFHPPWYEYPPIDFVVENFWPWELRDERAVDFQMVPQPVVSMEDLRGRAQNLRDRSQQGNITSLESVQPVFNSNVPSVNTPVPAGTGLSGQRFIP